MKNSWRLILTVSFLAALAQAKGKAVRYPVVRASKGSVVLVMDSLTVEKRAAKIEEKQKHVKAGDVLKDKAWLRTGPQSEMWLVLSASASLVLLENSEIEIPAIAWEDGAITQIHLHEGQVRYRCEKQCDRKFDAPIFDSLLPEGDFLLSYESKLPRIELQVLAGETLFRGHENETSLTLKAGEKAQFTGVMENGEPAFDVLLAGRKVAKGLVSEVQKIPESERLRWKKQDEKSKAQAAVEQKKAVVIKKPSQICEKPLGELNQCSWNCEKNPKGSQLCALDRGAVCVRTRCNANGTWSDRTEMAQGQNKCGLKTLVDKCDY